MANSRMCSRADQLMVVEDDRDIRNLVRLTFLADPPFELDGEATAIDEALEIAKSSQPDLIVLDHRLEGDATGLEAAPDFKEADPSCSIILFSASEELRGPTVDSPWIDTFVLKTEFHKPAPMAKQLQGVDT